MKRLAAAALLALGCGAGAAPVTGVHVTVDFSGLMLDQIQFLVTPAGGTPVTARRPDPAAPGAWLRSPQDVMIYLSDDLAGHGVLCAAQGMSGGAITPALGAATATLVLHELVPVSIAMVTPSAASPAPPPPPPPPSDASPTQCAPGKKGHGCD